MATSAVTTPNPISTVPYQVGWPASTADPATGESWPMKVRNPLTMLRKATIHVRAITKVTPPGRRSA
jgi:hypothetical protein